METHNDLIDLHSLLTTIPQNAVDRANCSKQSSRFKQVKFTGPIFLLSPTLRVILPDIIEELFTPFITIMVILIQILTIIWTLVFTLKCLKRYLPKLFACSRDIFTVCCSTFLSISKCFSSFHPSTNTSNTDESSNQEDILSSGHNRLQPLVTSGSRECFSRANTL